MQNIRNARAYARPVAPGLCALLMAGVLPAAAPAGAEIVAERTYRADANVVLFGITVFSRSDVGGGFARLVETSSGSNGTVRLLFVSGSQPDRAHGLNRMGYMEESVAETNARPSHADYFEFMTANGEENLADARKALHGPSDGDVPFVAARGEIDGANARHTVGHVALPASCRWTNAQQLLDVVKEDLNGPGESPGTFLYTVLSMERSAARTNDATFVHNGKLFRLHAVKRVDEKMGAQFVDDRLISSSRDAVELAGLIRNATTGTETTFRVWFDRTSPNLLPLRFEFQPKSYLRLTFEALPAEDPGTV
ncbi:MAG: hypothetical protein ABSB67_20305, partial [Bryobacteraceae bacterium]